MDIIIIIEVWLQTAADYSSVSLQFCLNLYHLFSLVRPSFQDMSDEANVFDLRGFLKSIA